MAGLHHRSRLRLWTVAVAALTLVAAGVLQAGTATASPGGGSGSGSSAGVLPLGDKGWRPAKPPKSTKVAYKAVAGRGGAQVLKPDPHAKRVKELTERRTANSSAYRMSDGSVQQEVSAVPVHYRDAKGAWQPIDSTLKPVSHNGFTVGARANAFQTYFSAKASSLVRLELGSASVQVGADGATTKAPKTSGSSVSYPGAYPGADLSYQVGAGGVKESIVLSGPPSAGQSYAFTVKVGGGLVAEQLPGGAIVLHGTESDTPVFTIPAPYMADSKADRASPYGKVYSRKVSQAMSFDAAAGTLRVTVTPDAGWLGDPKRVYPVTVDPTFVVAPVPSQAQNTMIQSDDPTGNNSTSWRLSVGTTTTGDVRSLIKIPLPSIPAGTTITSADLALYYDQVFYDGAHDVPMQALQANAAWTASTATWTSAASIGGPVAGTSGMKANVLGDWVHFPVASAVQNWVNGTTNNGFVLKATDETKLGQGGPRFEGSIYAYGGEVVNYPKLTITYGAPGVSVNPPTIIHATGAELSWPAYTNSTGDPNNDLVEYQVHRSVYQSFTPGQDSLIAPVGGARSFVDSTAVPTPANSSDPYGNVYYYMVVAKTKGNKLIAGPTQIVRLPKAGRTSLILPAVGATTLSSTQPTTVLNSLVDVGVSQPWLEVGDNSASYGVTRSVFDFGQLGQVPAKSKILDSYLKVWQETTSTGKSGSVYELHSLTRSFTNSQATWNNANSTTPWTTKGGDFTTTAYGTVSNLANDPSRRTFDATALVQGWINTAGSDHGLLVKLKGEAANSPQERTIFAGMNTAEPRLAPALVVTYLDNSTGATYYAPSTPTDMVNGSSYTTPVTVNNTSGVTWAKASEVLTYHWNLPDGTDVTGPANQVQTTLPADLLSGDTVTLNAQVKPPANGFGNQAESYTLSWDMYNTATSTYLSQDTTWGVGSLKQWISVDPSGNNQLGLEKFYQYATTPTGAGSNLYTNLSSGNAAWNYDLFANPSRGFTTSLRLSYNSLSTMDTTTGFGWSIQASAPVRLGQALQFNPNPNPTEVVAVDGTGNAHKWTWNSTTGTWASPSGVHLYLTKNTSCGPQTSDAHAWLMTRPDRTKYWFDCAGYPTSQVDAMGNEADFIYSDRQSQNKPTEFLSYISDPVNRQTLTLSYYNKGDTFKYVDSSTWSLVDGTNLTNPAIIDHVKSITDVSGRTVNFYYTTQGLLGQVVDGAGDVAAKTFNFFYDMTQGMKNVKLLTVKDPRGNTTAIAYYPQSTATKWLVQSVTDRLKQVEYFSYLQPGTITGSAVQTTVTDANTHNYVYQMDSAGRMIQAVNPMTYKTALAWDGDNNVTTLTEDNGAVTSWTYDQLTGYPLTFTDAQWRVASTNTYQTALNGHIADLTDTVSGQGRHWHYTYDGNGNRLSAQAPEGTAAGATPPTYLTTYGYDGFGSLLTVTDANQHTTNYGYYRADGSYEPTGQPVAVTDPLGNVTHTSYGGRGETASVTDPLGHTATYNHDVFLRPTDSQVPKDQASGSFITTPAPGYDRNDNITQSTDATGAVATAAYDAGDQTSSTTLPPNNDAASPPRTVTYTYDAVGNRKTATEPNGNLPNAVHGSYTTKYEYNTINELISVTDALSAQTSYGYDTVGNRTSVTDPLQHTTTIGYDRDHRATGTTDAASNTTSVDYDLDGLTLSTTDQNGHTTNYSLDRNGQVIQVLVPHVASGSDAFHTTKISYDQVGNRTSVESPNGVATATAGDFTTSTSYDADNRVSKQFGAYLPNDPNYDLAERPETDYSYDPAGRLQSATQVTITQHDLGSPTTTRATTSYGYFDNGWTKTSTDPFSILTAYDYDNVGRQANRKLTAESNSATRTMQWGYYPDGALKSFQDSGLPAGWQDQILLAGNEAAGGSLTNWTPVSGDGNGYGGADYWTATGGSGFTWNVAVPQDGNYSVWVHIPNDPTLGTGGYTVNYDGGGSHATVQVNQGASAGTWVQLTTSTMSKFPLTAGKGQSINLLPLGKVAADAVRITRDDSTDTTTVPENYSYTYDADGNRTFASDNTTGGQLDNYPAIFDQADRLTQLQDVVAGTVKHTLGYTYYPNGTAHTQTADARTDTYTYTPLNQLATVLNQQSSADPGLTTSYTYTPTGRPWTETKGNQNKVTATYNLDDTLATSVENTATGTKVDSHSLTYDFNNNITKDDMSVLSADTDAPINRTVTRAYTPNNQVKSVSNSDGADGQTYTYDSAGNVSTQNVGGQQTRFNYDRGRMEYTTSGTSAVGSYQYDTLGRLHAVTNGSGVGIVNGISQAYKYDAFDNILQQQTTNGTAVNTTDYTYDTLNRATTETLNATSSQSQTSTFNYLGTGRVVTDETITGFDGATKVYNYAPTGERLGMVNTSATGGPGSQTQDNFYTYSPHADVEALTNTSGHTFATYGYTAYGADAVTANSTGVSTVMDTGVDKPGATTPKMPYNAYRFNSARIDVATANLNMGARSYDPNINRFMSRDNYTGAGADQALGTDPWAAGGYGFAGGNPVSNIELDGHDWKSTAGSIAVGVGITAGCILAGVATEGLALIGCGVLAGAGAGAAGQGIACGEGQAGACSGQAFAQSIVVGGFVGGLTAGVGGEIAGALPSTMSGWASGAIVGAGSGAVGGGATYGLTCGDSCSLVGAGEAIIGGALLGGALGAGIGALTGPAGPRQAEEMKSLAVGVHNALAPDTIAMEMRVTAAIRARTQEGNTVDVYAGSGKRGLNPAQRTAVKVRGGVLAPNTLDDAEITALAYITKQQWKPIAGAVAGKPSCPMCTNGLLDSGATFTGPLEPYRFAGKAVFGQSRFFW
jgi:RHS repeat-associated protein